MKWQSDGPLRLCWRNGGGRDVKDEFENCARCCAATLAATMWKLSIKAISSQCTPASTHTYAHTHIHTYIHTHPHLGDNDNYCMAQWLTSDQRVPTCGILQRACSAVEVSPWPDTRNPSRSVVNKQTILTILPALPSLSSFHLMSPSLYHCI